MTLSGCKSSRTRAARGYKAASGRAIERKTRVQSVAVAIKPACFRCRRISARVVAYERFTWAHLLAVDEDRDGLLRLLPT